MKTRLFFRQLFFMRLSSCASLHMMVPHYLLRGWRRKRKLTKKKPKGMPLSLLLFYYQRVINIFCPTGSETSALSVGTSSRSTMQHQNRLTNLGGKCHTIWYISTSPLDIFGGTETSLSLCTCLEGVVDLEAHMGTGWVISQGEVKIYDRGGKENVWD